MSRNRKGVSVIIATILTISLAVVGSAVFYVPVTSYMRPQAGFSPGVSITMGYFFFNYLWSKVLYTGGVPFTSVAISITRGASQLQDTYSSLISAGGGTATITVRGLSGGPYTAATLNTPVSGNLAPVTGASYAVIVSGTLTNGATYSQAFSVTASP